MVSRRAQKPGPWKYIKEMFEFYFTSETLNKRNGSLTKKIHLSCIKPDLKGPPQMEVTMQYSKRNRWK